jgi:hypothetical protein
VIPDSSVSVVIQGPREHDPLHPTVDITRACIERVRVVFPDSHIIYSTWEGVATDDLPIDEAVVCPDPGGFAFVRNDGRMLNNSLRLIRSTQAGLARVRTPYVLKLRSDLFLYDRGFLRYFDRFNEFYAPLRIFNKRILVFSLWTRAFHATPVGPHHRPFHVSDWAHFGTIEDMKLLWGLPEPSEPEFSHWHAQRQTFGLNIEPDRSWRIPPEQLLGGHLAAALGLYAPQYSNDCSFESVMASRWLIATNFVVLDQLRWRMVSLKLAFFQPALPFGEYRGLYTFDNWRRDYEAIHRGGLSGGPGPQFKHLISDPHRILRRFLKLLRLNEVDASRLYRKFLKWIYVH